MADSIRNPWILDYLISVAEEYGGDFSLVPRKDKGVKAQLAKFITFPPPDEAPCNLWVEISDKKHIIHGRLSADAVVQYKANPLHNGKSITSQRGALVVLKRFRVSFGRVARGESAGMSSDSTLFLDIDEISIKGASGESLWGSPVNIANNPNIGDWIHGLRQDGGGGNVLKLRKQEKEVTVIANQDESAKRPKITAADSHVQQTMDAMNVKVRVARKSDVHKPRKSSNETEDPPRPIVDKEALRRASWKRFHSNMVKYFRAPDDPVHHLLVLCGDSVTKSAPKASPSHRKENSAILPPSPVQSSSPAKPTSPMDTPPSSPPRSPSHWSPSVRGSPRLDHDPDSSATEEELDDDASGIGTEGDDDASGIGTDGDDDENDEHAVLNTSSTKLGTESPEAKGPVDYPLNHKSPPLSMPPPPLAQRPRRPSPSVPYATSSPQFSTPQDISLSRETDALPPSSFPLSFRNPPSPAASSPHIPSTPALNVPTVRRVPPPQFAPLRRDPDASGEGRVLVENSDTASPGSQRTALSQSQSQSQSGSQQEASQELGQSQSQAQSQRPSKLRNELGISENDAQDEDGAQDVMVTADGPPDESQEGSQDSQRSAKSRQSLSYKGDSQESQERALADLASPIPEGHDTTMAEIRPDEQASGGHADLPVNTQEADVVEPETRLSLALERRIEKVDVDQAQQSRDTSAPVWTVIPASSSAEDDDNEDDEADVDELLPDPMDMKDDDEGLPKKRARKSKGRTVKVPSKKRLDTDDERTATMVGRFVSQAQDRHSVPKAKTRERPAARAASPTKRPRLSTPPVEQRIEARQLKRRKKDADADQSGPSLPPEADVFTSEDSFREEPRKPSPLKSSHRESHEVVPVILVSRNAKRPSQAPARSSGASSNSKSPAHDPEAWKAPTFMRKDPSETTYPTATDAKAPAPGSNAPKRPISAVSPSESQEPPAKRRKTSAVPPASNRASSSNSEVNPNPARDKQLTTATPAAVTGVKVSKAQSSKPASGTTKVAASDNSARALPYLDLRARSHSSSRSSSRAGSRGAGPGQTSRPVPGTQPSTNSKGKAPMYPVKREDKDPTKLPSAPPRKPPVMPVLAGAKTVSSNKGHRTAEPSKKTATKSARTGTEASGSPSTSRDAQKGHETQPPQRPTQSTGTDRTRQMLDDHKAALHLTKTPGGPPLLDWNDLLEILLETGRAKTEAKRRAESKGGGQGSRTS